MIKKIFSKMTRERRKEFQIETYIYEEDGKKHVGKRAMTEDALLHVRNMYLNYERYMEWNIPFLASCELNAENDTVILEYIEGTSLSEQLVKAAAEENRTLFIELLLKHKKLITDMVGNRKEVFASNTKFVEVFGNYAELDGQMAATYLNIDTTFDNVIEQKDGQYVTIDHEWIFDFPLPINYVIFRAIYLFYGRLHKELEPFISEESIYEISGISAKERAIYRQMEAKFMAYAYGGEHGYQSTLKEYAKITHEVSVDVNRHFTQIYLDDGSGFSEEKSKIILLENGLDHYEIQISVERGVSLKAVRFDPMECPGIVMIQQVRITDSKGNVENVDCNPMNALYEKGNMAYFDKEDPQYTVCLKGDSIETICFCYKIEYANAEYLRTLIDEIKEKENFARMLENEGDELKNIVSKMEDEREQLKNIINEMENEKTEFIERVESTRFAKKALKMLKLIDEE